MKYLVKRISYLVNIFGIILLISSNTLFSAGAGSSSVSTLLIPVSAKISAFGESCVALEDDISLLNCNPAGISTLEGWNTTLMYQRGFAEDNYMNLHIGKDILGFVFGTSVLYYSTGEIDLYDSAGEKVTEVGKREIIGTLGVGKKLWILPIGINLKYISSELFGVKATAYAADVGVQYNLKNSIIGLSVRNIGTKIKYIAEEEPLPIIIQIGGSYKKGFGNYLLLLLDDLVYYVNEEEYVYMIGAEVGYNEFLYLRAGYQINLTETENKSFSFGVGFNYKKYILDYSLEIQQDLTSPHRISLSYRL